MSPRSGRIEFPTGHSLHLQYSSVQNYNFPVSFGLSPILWLLVPPSPCGEVSGSSTHKHQASVKLLLEAQWVELVTCHHVPAAVRPCNMYNRRTSDQSVFVEHMVYMGHYVSGGLETGAGSTRSWPLKPGIHGSCSHWAINLVLTEQRLEIGR